MQNYCNAYGQRLLQYPARSGFHWIPEYAESVHKWNEVVEGGDEDPLQDGKDSISNSISRWLDKGK